MIRTAHPMIPTITKQSVVIAPAKRELVRHEQREGLANSPWPLGVLDDLGRVGRQGAHAAPPLSRVRGSA